MKTINRYCVLLLGCLLVLPACSDFLDEDPKGTLTNKNFYKTSEDAVAATDAIYDYLISGYSPNGLWDENFGGLFYNDFWELPELMSDNAEAKIVINDYRAFDNFEVDAHNSRIRTLWRDFYHTIYACNIVVEKVPAIEMDETLQKQLIAEAKFFRALCYFELTRFYGDVPLQLTLTEEVDEKNIPRTPVTEIYPVILSDLEYAETHLVYPSRLGSGRPYALSASALMARVYLTIGMKQGNKTYLQTAVEKARLVIPEFPLFNEYEDVFKLENRFKGERIWEANFNATLSQGWKGNQFLVRLLPKMDTAKGGADNGQGYDVATDNLYSGFEIADKRRDVSIFHNITYDDGTMEQFDAAYFCKYWDRIAEPKGNESDATYPYLRTSEMYLIIAEALNEINQGPTTEAYEAINAIRNRAGLNNTTATGYADFKKAVLKERRCEFVMEGHRWHDLVRMCTFEEFKAYIQEAKPDVNPREANLLFPIPQRERDISGGVLTQNAGY